MRRSWLGWMAAGALGIVAGAMPAHATLSVSAAVGGAPTGVNYVNFDALPLGDAGGTSAGVTVSFTPDGQAVQGAASGIYAAPYLSAGNGTLFGDPANGPDTTTYLTAGIGTATLKFPGAERYVGLLWGSVDTFNTLNFYNGTTLVGTVTGSNVTSSANGDQGANGTYYVNINSSVPFTSVVASSSSHAFEFDNVAYNASPVPEPSALVLIASGMLGLAFARRRMVPGTASSHGRLRFAGQ